MGRLKHNDVLTAALLQWGSSELRDFPWRRTNDPWKVLVSEVMLQQTSVQRVIDKYTAFIEAFPTPHALAQSPLGDALALWQGLGYPRRCRNLREAARVISEKHLGVVPQNLDRLLDLPGVGPYTARAVLAFAFKEDVGVVDVNVARVYSRLHGEPLSARTLQEIADGCVPQGLSWEWNQLLMDLGARVCLARKPKCADCPVQKWCSFSQSEGEVDPARLSFGVSRPQPRFNGSDRQIRGQVLKIVLGGDHTFEEVVIQLDMQHDRERVERLVVALAEEGLIVKTDDVLTAP